MLKSKLNRFIMLFFALILSVSLLAQQRITGKVTSATDGKPIAGVNVIAKGTTSGVMTDADGNYDITVPPGTSYLDFSFIGFIRQSVPIEGKQIINVALIEDVQVLNEVVVVGYGEQSRSKITTSISKLDTRILQNAAIANTGSALQGTISGLRVINSTGMPGAMPSILLRGGASINNPGAPLVVIDGIVRSMADLNPSDIESIQVLKDAASTAIYGARANNGVILITTNKGKYGTSEVTFKMKTGFNFRREGYNYLGARDYIYYNRLGVARLNVARAAGGNSTYNPNNSNGYGLTLTPLQQAIFFIRPINASNRSQFQTFINEGWQFMDDPYTSEVDTIIFKDFNGQVRDAAFTKNPYTQDYYLSFTGGNEVSKFAASMGYYDEDGLVVGTKYKRYTGEIKGSYLIRKNLEVGGGFSINQAKYPRLWTSEANLFYRVMSLWPTFNPYDAEGKPASGNGPADGNPLYWLDKYIYKDNTRRTTFFFEAKWDILKNLTMKWNSSYYFYDYSYEYFNKASQRQLTTTPDVTRTSYDQSDRSLQQQHNVTINYNKSFGKHNINILLGGELFDVYSSYFNATGQKAPTDDIYTLNASTERVSIYSSNSGYRMLSGITRINYDFASRFLMTFVTRYDGISRLSKENRWGFFPGISLGWNLHQEDFFKNSSLSSYLSTFKPRISYGVNGNVAGLGDYEVQGIYSIQTIYSGYQGFLNTGIVNPGLKWEKSYSFEAGADLGLLKNKIMLLANYYNRTNTDLLTNLALPGYTGFTSFRTNLGSLQNSGFETEITANILNMDNGLRWDISFNASFNKNKIIKLPDNGNEKNRQGGLQVYDPKSGKVIWVGGLQEGETIGDIYAYKQERILKDEADVLEAAGNRYDKIAELYGPIRWSALTNKTGKMPIEPGDVLWADLDKNDTIDYRDRVKVGNIYPKWTGGFWSSISFKGISLYARFDYAIGHTIYNDLAARTLGQYQGTFNIIDWVLRSWSPDNPDTDIPKFYYADQLAKKNFTRENNANPNLDGNNSRFYEKGDYLALREVTLSWQLPKILVSKISMSSATIYITGQNVAYFTKYSGTAPEAGGVDNGRYPLPRTVIMGLQAKF